MNFRAILHGDDNDSTFQLSVFSTRYLQLKGVRHLPCESVNSWCLCLCLTKPLACQGLTTSWCSGRSLPGSRTAAVDRKPLVRLQTGAVGKPRHKKAQIGPVTKISSHWPVTRKRILPPHQISQLGKTDISPQTSPQINFIYYLIFKWEWVTNELMNAIMPA
jgi:hypothetical protein